jgi:hypothetical protein
MNFYKISEKILLFFLLFISSIYILLIFGHFEAIIFEGKTYIHTADDHMITMRVADNFSKFGQPFFNEGEAVAANTSLFWPMILGSTIMSLPVPVSTADIVGLNIILSVAISACTILLAASLVKGLVGKIAVAVAITTSSSFLTYATTGWEHIPQMFFVTLGFALILHKSKDKLVIPNLAFVAICLSFLFRPDSAILIAVTGIAWFFYLEKYRVKSSYIVAALMAVIPITYLFLMNYFYDDWFPNTAYLKTADFGTALKSGLVYIINPDRSSIAPYIILALWIFKPANIGAKFFIIAATFHLFYVFLIGGDFFQNGRFFIVITPILYVVAFNELSRRLVMRGESNMLASVKAATFSAAIILVFSLPSFTEKIFYSGTGQESVYQEELKISAWINNNISPESGSVGLHALGFAYHLPNYHVVDFLGKAEKTIAHGEIKHGRIGHNKWDYEYVFNTYDISVIPIEDDFVSKATDENYVRIEEATLFVLDCVAHIESLGNYTFYPASFFGNKRHGAYIRNDIEIQLDTSG